MNKPRRPRLPRRAMAAGLAGAFAAALSLSACGAADEPAHSEQTLADHGAPASPNDPVGPDGADAGAAGEGARAFQLANPANPGDIAANGVLTVINRDHPIYPLRFRPADLTRIGGHYVSAVAVEPMRALMDAAEADGLRLRTRSGFRSFERQETNNAAVVRMLGPELALLQSAAPGHSEHQTGLAMDLLPFYGHACADFYCFADTPHAAWLEENAHRFGFIVRYREDQEHITGFSWEPWHVRYIGVDAATALHAGGYLTLEEFLGLLPR